MTFTVHREHQGVVGHHLRLHLAIDDDRLGTEVGDDASLLLSLLRGQERTAHSEFNAYVGLTEELRHNLIPVTS